jgi:hypothetical protein
VTAPHAPAGKPGGASQIAKGRQRLRWKLSSLITKWDPVTGAPKPKCMEMKDTNTFSVSAR